MLDFKHSIATVSLSGTLIEKIKAIAKAGYDGFELFENDLTVSDISPKDIKNIYSDLGLELIGLQPLRDFEAMPEPYKSRNIERAKHKFDLMHKLGTKKLFVCSNTSIHSIDNPEMAVEDLFRLAEMAQKHGFEIGYEALSWGRHVKTYQQSVAIVNKANHPALGHILDNFHINVLKSSYEDIYSIPKEKFTMIQVGDSYRYDMGAMHVGRHLRCFPGQGTYPVLEFVNAVRATGYNGYLSHEIFNDEFRASSSEPVALDGKRSLIWLGENTFNAKNKESNQLENIKFISFSQNDPSTLISVLESIGFVETYFHKTKNISCFSLREASIMIHQEKSSLNSSTGICFKIQDIESQRNRALKLKYDWQNSESSTSFLRIPFVKNCNDINYFFIEDNVFEKEFSKKIEPTFENKINENFEFKIDHIGLKIQTDFYQSNTLFYRCFLGLEIEESLEILDPRGIVTSTLAKNKSETIRIPMSRSQSLNNENFNDEKKINIQQIAFETNDIFEMAEIIKDKNLILPIPINYYEDLKSKSFLNIDLIEKMQSFNILYDRQETGEFFHFYLKEIDNLFFEIIERKGNYNRFGEVNAQIRLAAQERDRLKINL